MLTTQDVCALCEVPVRTLNEWVAQGHIHPATPGRRGPGNARLFSPQQTVGIAVAAALIERVGCKPQYVAEIVGQCQRISDDDMQAWVSGQRPSPWAEERSAADRANNPLPAPLPGSDELGNDMARRIGRVLTFLRARAQAVTRATGRASVSGDSKCPL